MIIPYIFNKDNISFVQLKKEQYDSLLKDYTEHGYFFYEEYKKKLENMMIHNGHDVINVFCVNGSRCNNGCIIGLGDNIENMNMKVGVSRFERDFNVQEIHFWKEKPTDFELLNCIVSIFRCYKWPYENCLEDNIMEMMKQTYQKKRTC